MAKNPNTCSTCRLRPATRGRLCMQCYHHAHSKRQNYKQRCADGYGGRCACCGETNIYFLTIDHVDGIANEPRAEFRKRGPTLHARLIRAGFPSGFQCLCMQCNWAKGLHGLCPHNPAFPKGEEGEIVLTPRQQESLKRPAKKVHIRPEKQFTWVREDTP